MEEERTENECCEAPECPVMHSNRGAISIEVILVLVVLIALIVIFKAQITALAGSIWKGINNGAKSILN